MLCLSAQVSKKEQERLRVSDEGNEGGLKEPDWRILKGKLCPEPKEHPIESLPPPRSLESDVIGGESRVCIQEALSEVFESNKKDYLLIMARLLPFVIPKATEVPTNERLSASL